MAGSTAVSPTHQLTGKASLDSRICFHIVYGGNSASLLSRAVRAGGLKLYRLIRRGTSTDPNCVVRRLHHTAALGIKEGELTKAEREIYGLRLARIESNACEALQATN